MPLSEFSSFDAASGKPLLNEVDGESISFTAEQVRLFLRADAGSAAELGTLWITTRHVIWRSLSGTIGYRLEYPYILLHAVCRDTTNFPYPCLYAQLDEDAQGDEEAFTGASNRQAAYEDAKNDEDEEIGDETKEDEEEEEQDQEGISELRFVPENPDILDALYSAMSECAALNPDEDGGSDGEGDFFHGDLNVDNAGEYADADGENEEYAAGEGGEQVDEYNDRMNGLQMDESEMDDAQMQRVENMLAGHAPQQPYVEGQYDDAEEDEEDVSAAAASAENAVAAASSSASSSSSRGVVLPLRPSKSGQPDSASQVASQVASAAAQVAQAAPSQPGKKRDRDIEEEQPKK